ncbi:MAG: cobalt-precorrin-6A reductase [Eubacteriales bacterium]|nr:cobalt-precorrin-6A reductase [Eubacteriales bacterium]
MILLLGGTIDSREIARELKEKKIDFITTTVSDYGKLLAEEFSDYVIKEVLDKEKLINFIFDKDINIIIDATHPFARNISENALLASEETNIKYLRYERPEIIMENNKNIFLADDLKEASIKANQYGNNILLTIGSRGLGEFKEVIEKKNVYARVLPEINSIKACENAGIITGNIIAMQGPFSVEFNKLLISEKNIDLLITKESGKAGGFEEKLSSVSESGINIIVIKRPKLNYPIVFNNINDLIKKIMEGS